MEPDRATHWADVLLPAVLAGSGLQIFAAYPFLGPRGGHYASAAPRRGRDLLPRAVGVAIVGEDLIRYTEEVVLPPLDRSLAALDAAAVAPS